MSSFLLMVQNRSHRFLLLLVLLCNITFASVLDSIFEPVIKSLNFLPDYYLRFGISTFALHRDSFFKRQYLAEPHPDLEFCLLSYNDLISSVWEVDFQFSLGNVEGDNIFTVLGVAFGINPAIELKLREVVITGGLAHRCFHGIDRFEYPVSYHNRLFLNVSSPNHRLNTYWTSLSNDSLFSQRKRLAWNFSAGYYLREFMKIDPDVLNGHNPLLWEVSSALRYAFYKRRSWVFTGRSEITAGEFSRSGGYHVSTDGKIFWKLSIGSEAFFLRGNRGGCFYVLYHLDELPVSPNEPSFSKGHARFSKNGLMQIGLVFFN